MKIIKEIDKIIEQAHQIENKELQKKLVNSLIALQEHFDITVRCVICNKEIINPRTGQVSCDSKKCKEEYYKYKQEEWKSFNKNK